MTILTTRQVARRPLPVRADRSPELEPGEVAAVKKAILFLAVRHGTQAKLAAALRVKPSLLARATSKRGKPGAALAIRCARLAGVSVESVLAGTWPPEGACCCDARPGSGSVARRLTGMVHERGGLWPLRTGRVDGGLVPRRREVRSSQKTSGVAGLDAERRRQSAAPE